MSSLDSNINDNAEVAGVVGPGMNEDELRTNRTLVDFVMQDLNRVAVLPFADDQFDAGHLHGRNLSAQSRIEKSGSARCSTSGLPKR